MDEIQLKDRTFNLTIYESKNAIKNAIANLDAIGKEAAQVLGHCLNRDKNKLDNEQYILGCFYEATANTYKKYYPQATIGDYEDFLDRQGDLILNIAVSIIGVNQNKIGMGNVLKVVVGGIAVAAAATLFS